MQGGGEAPHGTPAWDTIEDTLKDPEHMRRILATRPPLPGWANQSQMEHDAELGRVWRARTTANRRILQGADEDDDSIMHLLPGPIAWCDDPLATNMGEGGRCAYDCEMLQRHYFPAEESRTSRCFRYDTTAGSWPDALLARKHAWSDSNNTIVIPNDENWIIQGALGRDGVPVKLDARLSSGSAVDFSEASIVVRHVRFSGQSAPLDPYVTARTYTQAFMNSPYFGGGENRLGGAFSYDGGGLNPEVHTPKLVFEQVVFDRNRAISYAAVWIGGRSHTMSSLDLVVDGCLFFRNAATFLGSALYIINTMPGTYLVNNTEFFHNTAFVAAPISVAGLDTKVGVQGRREALTIANSHVDGGDGWSLQGGGFLAGTMYATTADGTFHEYLWERVTVVHINAAAAPLGIMCHGNGLQDTHCMVRDCHIARVVGVEDAVHTTSYGHTIAIQTAHTNSGSLSRLTLEASGSFVDRSHGQGVLMFHSAGRLTAYPPDAEFRVADSKFLHNQAAYGGAIGVMCDEIKVIVQRCYFEVGARQLQLETCNQDPSTNLVYMRRATWRQ
jgi:hypothetical protein